MAWRDRAVLAQITSRCRLLLLLAVALHSGGRSCCNGARIHLRTLPEHSKAVDDSAEDFKALTPVEDAAPRAPPPANILNSTRTAASKLQTNVSLPHASNTTGLVISVPLSSQVALDAEPALEADPADKRALSPGSKADDEPCRYILGFSKFAWAIACDLLA